MGERIIELNTENNISRNKTGDYNQKWIKKTSWKTIQKVDNEIKVKFLTGVLKNRLSNSKKSKLWVR